MKMNSKENWQEHPFFVNIRTVPIKGREHRILRVDHFLTPQMDWVFLNGEHGGIMCNKAFSLVLHSIHLEPVVAEISYSDKEARAVAEDFYSRSFAQLRTGEKYCGNVAFSAQYSPRLDLFLDCAEGSETIMRPLEEFDIVTRFPQEIELVYKGTISGRLRRPIQ